MCNAIQLALIFTEGTMKRSLRPHGIGGEVAEHPRSAPKLLPLQHRIGNMLARNKKRIGIIALGHTASWVEVILFDHVLYGAVAIYTTTMWGAIWGSLMCFLIMILPSAATCYLLLRLYDWAKLDLLGLETLKRLREGTGFKSWFGNLVARIARKGDIPAFIAFSLYTDPLMTTLYLRKGVEQFNGMTIRDWQIFWASIVISNAYWTLRWVVIVEVAYFLWKVLF